MATDVIGPRVTLNGLKGKVVVLQFLASWCGNCMDDAAVLAEFYAQYRSAGLAIVGVTQYQGFFGDDRIEKRDMPKGVELARMRGLVAEHGMIWPVLFVDSATWNAYGVEALPQTVVIGRDGLVRSVDIGTSRAQQSRLRTIVRRLLEAELPPSSRTAR